MQRYNIAILPIDTALTDKITHISRQYFLETQDEYILGDDGLPHVTLCQFKTETIEQARAIYAEFAAQERNDEVSVTLEKFHARAGKYINAGKFIAEYKAAQEAALMAMQMRCAKILSAHGIETLTPVETYSPHITLARLSSMPDAMPTSHDLEMPFTLRMKLALGLSTEAGVFVKPL